MFPNSCCAKLTRLPERPCGIASPSEGDFPGRYFNSIRHVSAQVSPVGELHQDPHQNTADFISEESRLDKNLFHSLPQSNCYGVVSQLGTAVLKGAYAPAADELIGNRFVFYISMGSHDQVLLIYSDAVSVHASILLQMHRLGRPTSWQGHQG